MLIKVIKGPNVLNNYDELVSSSVVKIIIIIAAIINFIVNCTPMINIIKTHLNANQQTYSFMEPSQLCGK